MTFTPTSLGNYTVVREIARGGMGIVYEGEDQHLGRRVALKVLGPWLQGRPDAEERLVTEARTLAKLRSSGIVQVFAADREESLFYFAMEYVEGKPLSGWLEEGEYGVEGMIEIARQLTDALAAAHDAGVIHRDLKPANILSADGRTMKIADFGLSRSLNSSLTATDAVLGTPMYMAPEQVHGKDPTPATDIYSLGIILYELITGDPPFCVGSPIEIAMKHVKDHPADLREIDSDVPWGLRDLTMNCLHKEPAERPTTDEVRHALSKLAENRSALQRVLTLLEALEGIHPDDQKQQGFRSTWAVVMSVDVSGFNQVFLSARPDVVGRFLSGIHQCTREAVESEQGVLVKKVADNCLSVFLGEVKRDAVARALTAAARLNSEIANVGDSMDLSLRIGMHCGDVMFGPTFDGSEYSFEIVGGTVNVAVGCESRAEPGSILVSASVADLLPSTWSARATDSVEAPGGSRIALFSVSPPPEPEEFK